MKKSSIIIALLMALTVFAIPSWNGTAYADNADEGTITEEETEAIQNESTEELTTEAEPTVDTNTISAQSINDPFEITPKTMTIDQPYTSYLDAYVETDASFKDDPYIIHSTSTRIMQVESSNENVVKLEEYVGDYKIIPIGVGTSIITCSDVNGNTDSCTITVTNRYIGSMIDTCTIFDNYYIEYGDPVSGLTLPGTTVSAVVAGRTYSTTTSTSSTVYEMNEGSPFTLRIPTVKIGSIIAITVKYHGGYIVRKLKVVKPVDAYGWLPNYVYRNSKKMKVEAECVHAGDTVIVKIGKKTYKKKIIKNAKKIVYVQKIKKPKKWGKKITITVKNKFNQTVSYETDKVFYGSKLKKKMTKKKCLCISGWEDPNSKTVSGKYTYWWYDDDDDGYYDSYLKFKGNKLVGWHY